MFLKIQKQQFEQNLQYSQGFAKVFLKGDTKKILAQNFLGAQHEEIVFYNFSFSYENYRKSNNIIIIIKYPYKYNLSPNIQLYQIRNQVKQFFKNRCTRWRFMEIRLFDFDQQNNCLIWGQIFLSLKLGPKLVVFQQICILDQQNGLLIIEGPLQNPTSPSACKFTDLAPFALLAIQDFFICFQLKTAMH
eukprot:TRINITY_DN2474_c0_g1_i4.p1 TRINITY_DN2474_c0_g1~~TRINITY_DN2474_c0_g1_i4.p1  ORF type:complete len:190 (-),score=5.57 TRINITY_DN2474_c0_g1_i4:1558-2127(-)